MKYEQFKNKLMEDSEFKREFEKRDLALEIGLMVEEARLIKGVTQDSLAKIIGTKQSSVARLESGKFLPSLRFLKKIADAFKSPLTVEFEFLRGYRTSTSDKTSGKTEVKQFFVPILVPLEVRKLSYDTASTVERYQLV